MVNKIKTDQLKNFLRFNGLKVTGKKNLLQETLWQWTDKVSTDKVLTTAQKVEKSFRITRPTESA